jgi:filamentous hemagglutinin
LSGSIHITGTVKSNHGSVSFDAAQGSVTLANGAAGKITAGTDITISGGTLHLGSLSAGSSLQLTASNTGRADSIVVHGNVSATHVRMDAIGSGTGGDITLTGNIFAGTNTSSSAQHGVLLNATNAGTGGGDITVNGKIIASSGSISLNANGGGDIKVTGSMSASNGAVKVTANGGGVNGGRVQLGNIAASNSISINDAYTGTAPGGATVGNLDASTVTVVLTQGNLTIGQLVKPGATIKASNGSITDSVTGNLDLSGETLQAFDGVHLKATGNITLNSTSFGGSAFSASAGGNIVEASANPLILSGQVLKAGHLLVLSAGTIDLGAAKLTASSIQLSATSINNASGNGSITAAKGTIHATHGIFLANENIVVSGAGPLISAASVDLDDAVVSGTGVLSIKTSGDLQASDLTVTAAGLKITAGHDADLSGAHINSTKVSINAVHDVNISGAQVVGSAVGISAGSILNGSAPGKIIAGKGGLTLKSKGDMQLAGETLNIAGTGLISAAGNLDLAGAKLSGVGPTTLHAGTDVMLTGATLTLSMTVDAAGGSIDLTGATANVSALALQAKKDIILSGVHINAGVFTASASGTIHNGGAQGAITANAIKVDAKQDIDLSSTVITLGSGALTGVTGDTTLLQLLAAAGLKPASAAPNGAFMAGGSLTLGALNITGNYLVLQGSSIAILGPVTAPAKGLVVEVRPTDPAAGIGVEGQLGTGQSFNISNQGFFALFPGDTIVVGDDAESGNIFIGANGPFTLAGGTNLLFDTTGSITGLDKITSTGLVGSLETIAAAASDNNIVTAGEIDPSTTSTSLGDQTDKKRLGSGQNDPNGEGAGGTISQDSGTSSVCH